jgi:hypothetical protein
VWEDLKLSDDQKQKLLEKLPDSKKVLEKLEDSKAGEQEREMRQSDEEFKEFVGFCFASWPRATVHRSGAARVCWSATARNLESKL